MEDLADKAECSRKTISSVEASKNVYRFTLNKIANAFGVEPHTLFYHSKDRLTRHEDRLTRGRAVILITTPLQIEDVDESDLSGFFRRLADAITATDSIEVTHMKAGSVIFSIELPQNDALRLAGAFMACELFRFGIADVELDVCYPPNRRAFIEVWDALKLPHYEASADAPKRKPEDEAPGKKRRFG